MMRASKRVRLFWRRKDGAVAVEFAMIGGVLAFLMLGAADLGLAFYSDMQVQAAAQAGVQYAMVHGYNATAISTATTHATTTSGISSTSTQFCGCPSSTSVATTTCSSNCSDGKPAGVYVSVTASRTYSTLFDYPLVSDGGLFQTSTSTVRIQ